MGSHKMCVHVQKNDVDDKAKSKKKKESKDGE